MAINRPPEELIPIFSVINWISLKEWLSISSRDPRDFCWDEFVDLSIVSDPAGNDDYHQWIERVGKCAEDDEWECKLCGLLIERHTLQYDWDEEGERPLPYCPEFNKPSPEPYKKISGQQTL